jgi:glycosyltransferase involved in cell wall biosynthesis
MTRVLGIFKSPTPYFSNLLKLFSNEPDIELKVVFCAKTTDGDKYLDGNSNSMKEWGLNVLDGYDSFFLNDRLVPLGFPDYKITDRKIGKYIQTHDYDVILMANGYWSLTTWYAIKAAQKQNIPIITRSTVETTRERNKALLLLKKFVVGNYCKKMRAGVYECNGQKEYLIQYGMKIDDLFYAPCAVDNAFFQQLSKSYSKDIVRKKLKINDNSVTITTTGQLIPRKRPWDLIHVYELLTERGYNIEMFLVGDGSQRAEIEKYKQEKGYSSIHLTGKVTQTEVGMYLAASDIYVIASDYDASPKALNEAMNFGLPVIATSGISTAPELIAEGVNGYIYKAGDIDELGKCISEIIDNNCLNKMGDESLKIISENGFDRVIKGWLEAVEHCVSCNK